MHAHTQFQFISLREMVAFSRLGHAVTSLISMHVAPSPSRRFAAINSFCFAIHVDTLAYSHIALAQRDVVTTTAPVRMRSRVSRTVNSLNAHFSRRARPFEPPRGGRGYALITTTASSQRHAKCYAGEFHAEWSLSCFSASYARRDRHCSAAMHKSCGDADFRAEPGEALRLRVPIAAKGTDDDDY